MYSFVSRVRYSECDAKSEITLPALVNYLQDCCTFQSEDLGIGLEYLKEHKEAWVLSSWQIVVDRYPKMGEEIKISTWPYSFKGFYGFRNFTIEDCSGKVLAYANSVWVYLDTETGRPKRISKEVVDTYSYDEQYPMDCTSRKVAVPEKMEQMPEFPVQKFHIDTNHHVNNEKYILLAQECLEEGIKIQQVRVEYKKAAVLGDMIYPRAAVDTNKSVVALSDEAGKPYAIVEFTHERV